VHIFIPTTVRLYRNPSQKEKINWIQRSYLITCNNNAHSFSEHCPVFRISVANLTWRGQKRAGLRTDRPQTTVHHIFHGRVIAQAEVSYDRFSAVIHVFLCFPEGTLCDLSVRPSLDSNTCINTVPECAEIRCEHRATECRVWSSVWWQTCE
jgi:hypothetical protein